MIPFVAIPAAVETAFLAVGKTALLHAGQVIAQEALTFITNELKGPAHGKEAAAGGIAHQGQKNSEHARP